MVCEMMELMNIEQERSNCSCWEGEAQEVQEAGRGEGGGQAEHQRQGGHFIFPRSFLCEIIIISQYNLEKPVNDDDEEDEDEEDDSFGAAKKKEEDDDPIKR